MFNKKSLLYISASSVLFGVLLCSQLQFLWRSMYVETENKNIVNANAENPQVITFEDKAVENITRTLLKKPEGSITTEDVLSIEHFGDFPYYYDFENTVDDYEEYKKDFYATYNEYKHYFEKIKTFSDLKWFENLKTINMSSFNSNVKNISGIENLDNLEIFMLNSNKVNNLDSLSNLKNLKQLVLIADRISDLTPLKELSNLENLEITGTNLRDIRPIEQLTNLKQLVLNASRITDLTPLKKLTKLEKLEITGTSLRDIRPIEQLTNLKQLVLNARRISDLTPLKELTNLERLEITGTSLRDIRPIEQLTNLKYLNISGQTHLSDISAIRNLTNLTDLYLTYCNITDISALENLKNLKNVDLTYNFIRDISPLKNIITLESLIVDNNNITDISPVLALPRLNFLSVEGNNIDEKQLEQLKTERINVTYETIVKLNKELPKIKVISDGYSYRDSSATTFENIIIKNAENEKFIQQIPIKSNINDTEQQVAIYFEDVNFDGIKDLYINRNPYFILDDEYYYNDYYLWDSKSFSFVYNETLSNLRRPTFNNYDNTIINTLSEADKINSTVEAYRFTQNNLTKTSEIKMKTYYTNYNFISKFVESPKNYKGGSMYYINNCFLYFINKETGELEFNKEYYDIGWYNESTYQYEVVRTLDIVNDIEIIDKYIVPFVNNYNLDEVKKMYPYLFY